MPTAPRAPSPKDPSLPLPARAGLALGAAGPSITLAAACEVLAFGLGALLTPMPAVRSFSIVAAAAVALDFALQVGRAPPGHPVTAGRLFVRLAWGALPAPVPAVHFSASRFSVVAAAAVAFECRWRVRSPRGARLHPQPHLPSLPACTSPPLPHTPRPPDHRVCRAARPRRAPRGAAARRLPPLPARAVPGRVGSLGVGRARLG